MEAVRDSVINAITVMYPPCTEKSPAFEAAGFIFSSCHLPTATEATLVYQSLPADTARINTTSYYCIHTHSLRSVESAFNCSPPASVGNLEIAAVRECVHPSTCPQLYLDNRLIDLTENLHSDSLYMGADACYKTFLYLCQAYFQS